MAKLGEAYSKAGETEVARALFNQLVAGSRDDYALSGALGLDALDRASGTKPNEFDALRRARVYLFNRHWPEARADLISIVERFPDSPNRPEALYQTGFSFYREDLYDDAIKWFERAHAEFPNKKEGEQGYYWVATALQKARRYDEAARRYISFVDAYPRSDLVEGAYRNAADALRYADKYSESIEWSRRIVTDFAGKPLARFHAGSSRLPHHSRAGVPHPGHISRLRRWAARENISPNQQDERGGRPWMSA